MNSATTLMVIWLGGVACTAAGAEPAKPALPDPDYCARRDADPQKCMIQNGPPHKPIVRKKKPAPPRNPPAPEKPAGKSPAKP